MIKKEVMYVCRGKGTKEATRITGISQNLKNNLGK
jgi:hypothetical protein